MTAARAWERSGTRGEATRRGVDDGANTRPARSWIESGSILLQAETAGQRVGWCGVAWVAGAMLAKACTGDKEFGSFTLAFPSLRTRTPLGVRAL